MANAPTFLDIDDENALLDLPKALAEAPESIVLRKNGREIAVVTPLDSAIDPEAEQARKRADYEAFLSSFGAWKGHVDDDFVEQVYRDREGPYATPSTTEKGSVIRPLDSPEALAEFLSIAGGWADVDTDSLIEDLYRQRTLNSRPPIEW